MDNDLLLQPVPNPGLYLHIKFPGLSFLLMADSLPISPLQNLFHTATHQESNIEYRFQQILSGFFWWHYGLHLKLLHMLNEQYNRDNRYNAPYQQTVQLLPLLLLRVEINNDTMEKVFLRPCVWRSNNRSYLHS